MFGIKVYALCEPDTGCCLQCQIYTASLAEGYYSTFYNTGDFSISRRNYCLSVIEYTWTFLAQVYNEEKNVSKIVINRLRSSPPEVFSGEGVLEICSKFTGQHPC